MLGGGIAHLTIYLPALALYFIVLPRICGFSAPGSPLQLFALVSLFTLATSFMGQAAGAWFKHPETPRADIAEAKANHDAAVAGPTREERAIADAQVKAAASALAVIKRRLDKTILRAPLDGVVSVIVAEVGENIRAGEPVLVIEEMGKRWLSFNVREDWLRDLTVGAKVGVARAGSEPTPAVITELVSLGSFATWQAERAIGDHDRNTLRMRLEPQVDEIGFEPGMTVWFDR